MTIDFAIPFRNTAVCLLMLVFGVASALSQTRQERQLHILKGSDIEEVMIGDPKLPEMMAGKVVVLAGWDHINRHSFRRLANGTHVPVPQKEGLDECKDFARDFATLMRRFKDEPNVLFLGIGGMHAGYTKQAVIPHAKELNFPAPVVSIARDELNYSPGTVAVYDSNGRYVDSGKLDGAISNAIRKALRGK